jgi:hypothetical protein
VSESTTEIMMDNVSELDVNHSHGSAEDAGDYVNRAGRRRMRPMQVRDDLLPDRHAGD